jgi:hypothetical protein
MCPKAWAVTFVMMRPITELQREGGTECVQRMSSGLMRKFAYTMRQEASLFNSNLSWGESLAQGNSCLCLREMEDGNYFPCPLESWQGKEEQRSETRQLKCVNHHVIRIWSVHSYLWIKLLPSLRNIQVYKAVFFFLFSGGEGGFGVIGVWIQGFVLARQVLYSMSHASSTFIFESAYINNPREFLCDNFIHA